MLREKGFVVLLILFLTTTILFAQIPTKMEHQGKLTDLSGVGITDTLPMTFYIYDSQVGGTVLWLEIFDGVNEIPVIKGLYSVVLGSLTPIELPFDKPYWLEVEIDGDILDPRLLITSSAYAFRALYADSATYAATAESLIGGAAPGVMDTFIAQWDSLRGVPAGFADGVDNFEANTIDTFIAYWATLRNIPGGFADGVDDTGHFAGAVSDTFVAFWDSLRNVPIGFADGVDDTGHLTPADTFIAYWDSMRNIPLGFADGVDDTGHLTPADTFFAYWDSIRNVPAGFWDGIDDIDTFIAYWDSLRNVPAGFWDGVDNIDTFIAYWDSLRGVPGGFSDGVDNVGDNDWTVNGDTMWAAPSGNIGIGTEHPTSRLHLSGSAAGEEGITVSRLATGDPALRFYALDGTRWGITSNATNGKMYIAQYNSAWTFMANRFTILNDGKVGIGRATPEITLDVNGGIRVAEAVDSLAGTIRYSGGNFEGFNGADWVLLDVQATTVGGWTDADNYVYLTANSDSVGIGTVAPVTKLDVNGSINTEEDYMMDGFRLISNDGLNNIFVGESTGVDLSTGVRNTALGHDALANITYGTDNTALGYRALHSNQDGFQNVAVGSQTLPNNIDGEQNVAVGYFALQNNTDGYDNVAIGRSALFQNTSGFDNMAVGYHTLYDNTLGEGNAGIGANALDNNTEGSYNTAIGASALYDKTTGDDNVAIGYGTGYNNQTGNFNVYVGSMAGYGSGNYTADGCVFLGYKAGYSETDSNRLYIENSNSTTPLIYGEFDNDIVAINGALGVGTQSPAQELEVEGDVIVGGSAASHDGTDEFIKLEAQSEDWYISVRNLATPANSDFHIGLTQAEDGIFHIQPNGATGIGTTTPREKLEVNGGIFMDGGWFWGADTSGADSFWIYDDGDTTYFDADNPIKIGDSSLIVEQNGNVIITKDLTVRGSFASTPDHAPMVTVSRVPDNTGDFVCDGVNDDAEINAALSLLCTLGGGDLFIKAGNYVIDAPCAITCSNITIRGAGRSTYIRTSDESDAHVIMCFGEFTSPFVGIKIEQIRVSTYFPSGFGGMGIWFRYVNNSKITNCWVDSCTYDGINLEECKEVMVTINHLYGNFNGIFISGGLGHTVTSNISDYNRANGIANLESNYNTFTGNSCCDNLDHGIYLAFTYYSTVVSNECSGDSTGIELNTANNNTVGSNVCRLNYKDGIKLYSADDNCVTDNVCDGNSQREVGAFDAITVTLDSDYNVVSNNRCTGTNHRYGIDIGSASCDENVVQDNMLKGNRPGFEYNDSGTNTRDWGPGTGSTVNVVNDGGNYW